MKGYVYSTFKPNPIVKLSIDTAKATNYASHYAANHGNSSKLGQNIVGFYYK